jgi:hypothetical protein
MTWTTGARTWSPAGALLLTTSSPCTPRPASRSCGGRWSLALACAVAIPSKLSGCSRSTISTATPTRCAQHSCCAPTRAGIAIAGDWSGPWSRPAPWTTLTSASTRSVRRHLSLDDVGPVLEGPQEPQRQEGHHEEDQRGFGVGDRRRWARRQHPVASVDVSPTNASRLLAYARSPDHNGRIQIHDLAFHEPAPRAVKNVPPATTPRPGV